MEGFYREKIHGQFYPIQKNILIPNRYRELLRRIKGRAQLPLGPVLEVGSETATNPLFGRAQLGVPHQSFHCVDISSATIAALEQAGFSAKSLDVSTQPLPFPDGYFDAVIMSEVLEHLVDPDFAVRECRRVMKARGLFGLTTPNLAAWFNRMIGVLGCQPLFTETGTEWVFGRGPFLGRSRPVGHLRIFTRNALREFLTYHGFVILDEVGIPLERMEGVTRPIFHRVDRFLSRMPPLASDLLVIAAPEGRTSPTSRYPAVRRPE